MTLASFDRPLGAPLLAREAQLSAQSLVSVVMTCFNSANWIEGAIRSITRQHGWQRLELVVVNDASTDETAQLLDSLAGQDTRIRPFHLSRNHGTYRAKNIGISISRGELITFMDSDDVSHPERVNTQARLLLDSDLVACTCNYIRVTTRNEIIPMGGLEQRQALISLMFKRQVIADIGWFDGLRTSADDEFFERIRHVYGRAAHQNVARPLYRALHRENSLSTNLRAPVVLNSSDDGMLSPPRRAYVEAYRRWYSELAAKGRRPYMPFNPAAGRPFSVPDELLAP